MRALRERSARRAYDCVPWPHLSIYCELSAAIRAYTSHKGARIYMWIRLNVLLQILATADRA